MDNQIIKFNMEKFKTIVLFAAMVALTAAGNAQTIASGSIDCLTDAGVANIKIDYSKAAIFGMGETAFAEYEEDWDKDQPAIVMNIVRGINFHTSQYFSIGYRLECDLDFNILVASINQDGSWNCKATVTDKSGNVLCEITDIVSDSGQGGTKLRRIKKGALNTGLSIGMYLKALAKKANKK